MAAAPEAQAIDEIRYDRFDQREWNRYDRANRKREHRPEKDEQRHRKHGPARTRRREHYAADRRDYQRGQHEQAVQTAGDDGHGHGVFADVLEKTALLPQRRENRRGPEGGKGRKADGGVRGSKRLAKTECTVKEKDDARDEPGRAERRSRQDGERPGVISTVHARDRGRSRERRRAGPPSRRAELG